MNGVFGPRRRWTMEVADDWLLGKKGVKGYSHLFNKKLYESARQNIGSGWKPKIIEVERTLSLTHVFILEEDIPSPEAVEELEKYEIREGKAAISVKRSQGKVFDTVIELKETP